MFSWIVLRWKLLAGNWNTQHFLPISLYHFLPTGSYNVQWIIYAVNNTYAW